MGGLKKPRAPSIVIRQERRHTWPKFFISFSVAIRNSAAISHDGNFPNFRRMESLKEVNMNFFVKKS